MYEKIRKDRATRVQQASRRAGESMNDRIGFAPLTPRDMALATAEGKLTGMHLSLHTKEKILIPSHTVNEMNLYNMRDHIAAEVSKKPFPKAGHTSSRL